ncbi:MAG: hypothetical protein WBB25_12275 [Sulfitobacter sp.]
MIRPLKLTILAVVLQIVPACVPDGNADASKGGQQLDKPMENNAETGTGLTFEGQLVPGVTCPAIQLADGRTIALSHLLPGFDTGMRVTVSGSGMVGSMSCMQEVLQVTAMRPAS